MAEEITTYIPQRPPFVMIDELIEASEEGSKTRTHVSPENLLLIDGYLSEPGLMENIAQTAAAQAGFVAARQHKLPPVGFIANIKDFRSFGRVPAEADIVTEVRITDHFLNMTLARGTVFLNQNKVCECEMRIFINPEGK